LAEPPAPPVLAEPEVEVPVRGVVVPEDGETPPVGDELDPPVAPVLEPLPVVVAVLGAPVVLAPVVAVLPPEDVLEPVVSVDVPPEPVLDPLEDEVVSVDEVEVVSVEVLDVVSVEVPGAPAASAAEAFGVVMSGMVRGTASATWVPPQALRATPPVKRTQARAADRVRPGRNLGLERIHASCARRAVVEILLGELLAPGAEAQVLDRPGQPGRGWSEREQLADDLERLPGLPVDVGAGPVGLHDQLASGRRSPQPVSLAQGHAGILPRPPVARVRSPVNGDRLGWPPRCGS
jgi:hypothetical protein